MKYAWLLLFVCPFSFAGEFDPVEHPASMCPGDMFSQKAVVFDALVICATSQVDDKKLIYAANVAAKWLDNDDDGIIDEPRLLPELRKNNATLLMSETGFTDRAFENLMPYIDDIAGQDLSAEETNPAFGRDASQEEIHHLIINAGWISIFPKIFSDQKLSASLLYQQWELAEKRGYYAYGDPTCDDSCKVIEFFYLATAAYLGSSSDLVSDEMRIKNRNSLEKKLPEVVNIIESIEYNYPKLIWPNGKYEHQDNIHF